MCVRLVMWGFVMCGCICWFCNVWVFVCVVFVMCGCDYMCEVSKVCVYVWVL